MVEVFAPCQHVGLQATPSSSWVPCQSAYWHPVFHASRLLRWIVKILHDPKVLHSLGLRVLQAATVY